MLVTTYPHTLVTLYYEDKTIGLGRVWLGSGCSNCTLRVQGAGMFRLPPCSHPTTRRVR